MQEYFFLRLCNEVENDESTKASGKIGNATGNNADAITASYKEASDSYMRSLRHFGIYITFYNLPSTLSVQLTEQNIARLCRENTKAHWIFHLDLCQM